MKQVHALDRLEQGVLDDAVPLATLLRQVVVIGGRASSRALQDWALQELQGYTDLNVELPSYRRCHALIQVDSRSGAWEAKGQTISVLDLPESARKVLSEEVPIAFSVGKLQAMVSSAKPEEPIKLTPPGAAELARIMTYERRGRGVLVEAVYWSVHISVLQDVLDQVRTRLAQFVAELRSAMPDGAAEPTADQVHQAVQSIHITAGDNSPVNVTAPLAYAEQEATATAAADNQKRRLWPWRPQ
ncbi:hypothetical protein [Streptomyces sp. NPDC091217]|uniref:AbiTii domain-containing protein n=1 Tax=Streptomyces sp. NPDC091217 TaxID=3365975 RepID=UPI0038097DC9